MRTVNQALVQEYAEKIRPHLSLAAKAVGTQAPESPARRASDRVNQLLKEYMDQRGGNMTHLARELEGEISLPGLRRRLRAARGRALGVDKPVGSKRGDTDPVRVKEAADKIANARQISSQAYQMAVRQVYQDNISLSAVAEVLGQSYYSLWTAGTAGRAS